MEKMGIITLINLAVTYLISVLFLKMYGKAEDMGKKEISYSVKARRTYGLEASFRKYVYTLYGKYQEEPVKVVITEQEYKTLFAGSGGTTFVYMRRYPNKWLSPDWMKYEISLKELDWRSKDKKSVLKGACFMALIVEFLVFCFCLGI